MRTHCKLFKFGGEMHDSEFGPYRRYTRFIDISFSFASWIIGLDWVFRRKDRVARIKFYLLWLHIEFSHYGRSKEGMVYTNHRKMKVKYIRWVLEYCECKRLTQKFLCWYFKGKWNTYGFSISLGVGIFSQCILGVERIQNFHREAHEYRLHILCFRFWFILPGRH